MWSISTTIGAPMTTQIHPTIFLDFDGVLHPDEVYLVKGKPTIKGAGSLFMWEPVLANILSKYPNTQIVLSTSWVRELGFTRARSYLSDQLQSQVKGSTWHSGMKNEREEFGRPHTTWWDQATRYQQIMRYVNRAQLSRWIAIDDQDGGWDQSCSGRLIKTQPDTGLSDCDTQQKLDAFLAMHQHTR